VIDPAVPIPDWGLDHMGNARVASLIARLPDSKNTQVIASAERKAEETAQPFADRASNPLVIRPDMHENDRSATGYLPKLEFETVVDAFFANPEISVRGWERAIDAQSRIVGQVDAAIADFPDDDLLIVGHGGVGTLLYCHLAGVPIDRRWDQPGGGHWFAFDAADRIPNCHWQPMEVLTSI
jgi:broad specificity phosphatase PhoE